MADVKITALAPISANPVNPATFPIPMVDLLDNSMAASGTTKKVTVNQILGAGGTATLASATITGDLTVDTSTLKVDSANNRVGIGTASPASGYVLDVVGAARITAAGGLILDKAGAGFLEFRNSGNAGSNVGTSGIGGLTIYTADGIGGALGVRYVIDATGVSTWSVGGSTAMTLNSTGLGVGGSPVSRLSLGADANTDGSNKFTLYRGGFSGQYSVIENIGGTAYRSYGTGGHIWYVNNGTTEAGRFDGSGNLGVGVTPSAWGATYKAVQLTGGTSVSYGTGTMAVIQNSYDSAAGSFRYVAASSSAASFYQQTAGTHEWSNASAGTAGNLINGGTGAWTSRMLLDASGRLFVGKTSSSAANTGCELQTGTGGNAASVLTADGAFASIMNRLTSDGIIVDLRRETLSVGNISVTTTGATFNSTSDYRLKEQVQPMSGGLARVNALKPSVYKWKSNGSDGEGFLAHELAEIVPAAVNGEKDAVNDDGTIKAQSIDMSRVVPILVAAIKELAAEVNALKNA